MAKKSLSQRIYARIYDEAALKEMDGLIASGKFGSKSEIVAKCVEIALPYLLVGKFAEPDEPKRKSPDVAEMLRKQNALLRDVAVIANMTFNLTTSLFSERALTLEGVHTTAEDLSGGMYENLPPFYQDRLAELTK